MLTTNLIMHLKLMNLYLTMNNIITLIIDFLVVDLNSLRVITHHINADHRNPALEHHTRAMEYGKGQECPHDCKKHVNLNFKHMVNNVTAVHSEIAILMHPSIAFYVFIHIQKYGVHALRMDGKIKEYVVTIMN